MADLSTKRLALVTGSYRGTGAVVAGHLAAAGMRVLVHGQDEQAATATCSRISDQGGDALAVWGDLSEDEGVMQVASQAKAQGQVDVLVNNLGGVVAGSWFDEDLSAWNEAWNLNVLSSVRTIQAFVPAMRQQGWGRVILLSTIGTTRPAARTPQYYAAKASLPNMALSLAKELAGSGVTVNTVSPGLLRTPEVESWLRSRAERKGLSTASWEEIEAAALKDVAPNLCGRLGKPQDVAAAVAFLASEGAGFINATHLRVDGGAIDHVT